VAIHSALGNYDGSDLWLQIAYLNNLPLYTQQIGPFTGRCRARHFRPTTAQLESRHHHTTTARVILESNLCWLPRNVSAKMSDIEKHDEATNPNHVGSSHSDEADRRLEEVDPVYEAKLVRKLDIFIVPVVMLLYLLSFLDR
jgi:hypothetical protein